MTRDVRLVLCTSDGDVLGALPRFEVELPWWPEATPIVAGARQRFGVDVTVLRIVETDGRWPPNGGPVTYLAETPARPAGLEAAEVDMADHPLRARWARPGGVAELVAWADQHVTRTGEAEQLRTWNLSLVMRLPTTTGTAWLKAVPPFFAHEGAVIETVGEIGPSLLARDEGVVLLENIEGEDQWYASASERAEMVRRWVEVQATWSADVPGMPDWRPASFLPELERLVDRPEVEALVAEVPERFDALAECGLPDTLVHGDFHAGNWRGDTLIDWGDSGIGHPLLDQPAFLTGDKIDDEMRRASVTAWRDAWQNARPGSDPERAAELIGPIAALRQAHIYQLFLDNIEPSERCYHRNDPAAWLRRAVELRSRYSV